MDLEGKNIDLIEVQFRDFHAWLGKPRKHSQSVWPVFQPRFEHSNHSASCLFGLNLNMEAVTWQMRYKNVTASYSSQNNTDWLAAFWGVRQVVSYSDGNQITSM
jgi:hypothetical protein